VEKAIHWAERVCMAIAVLAVVVMMLVTSYDAAARYVFHAPLPWAFQLITYYLLGTALYLAVSATFAHGDHINIDLFRHYIPSRMRAVIDAVWSTLSACVFGVIAWGGLTTLLHAYERNEFLPGYFVWPAWLAYLPIALGAGLTALRLAHHAAKLAVRGEDRHVATPGAEHVE
jgi:TRAP-type C4-dicarboxylate transport system permease small subunit